jgi:hypothetical protein
MTVDPAAPRDPPAPPQAAVSASKASPLPGISFWKANIEVLSGRLPALAAWLEECRRGAGGPVLEPIVSSCGLPSARLGGLLLHSSRDPAAEAERLAAALPLAADTALVLGFGLGYQAEALLGIAASAGNGEAREARVGRVLVCEADPRLLAEALSARDLRRVLAREELGFLVGCDPDSLVGALDELGCRRLSILGARAVETAYPEWYGRLRAAAERYAGKESINENTLRRFGRLWVRNLARNLPLVGSLPGVGRLEGRFAGFPVVVLAAGPSLDEVLPHLPVLRRKALLVCVDTALRSVLRAGVEPDFLVVVDPQYWNWRHLEGLSSRGSILVSESAAWPAVFRFDAAARFLCSSLFPLGQAIERRAGAKGGLGAGGSVATTAWDLARLLGASSIYMAGLDLGFPSAATHARASLFEQRALASGCRLAPAETGQAAALFSGGAEWSIAADGSPLRTDKRMKLYAWWFESRLARPASPPTSRLSTGGLAIPGMGLARLEEFDILPDRRAELDRLLVQAAACREDAEVSFRAAEGLSAVREDLRRAYDRALLAASEASAAASDLAAGRDCGRRLAFLDRIDADLLAGSSNDVIGFLMPPLPELLGERARSLTEGLERSRALYESVAASARYHLDALLAADRPASGLAGSTTES